jgi:uncharacterized protein YndB with AHSA1/START domain
LETQPVVHTTFVIERNYPVTPERVFAAFAEPAKKRRWFVEGKGSEPIDAQMDFRVGGTERTRFRITADNPVKGAVITKFTIYHDIVPNRRIVLAYTMSMGERCFSASQSTFELAPVEKGTKLVFTEQAAFFENADGPKMREEGWRELLESLGRELARP